MTKSLCFTPASAENQPRNLKRTRDAVTMSSTEIEERKYAASRYAYRRHKDGDEYAFVSFWWKLGVDYDTALETSNSSQTESAKITSNAFRVEGRQFKQRYQQSCRWVAARAAAAAARRAPLQLNAAEMLQKRAWPTTPSKHQQHKRMPTSNRRIELLKKF